MTRAIAIAAWASGCVAEGPSATDTSTFDPLHPCATPEMAVEAAPPHGDYGEFADGADLWCGNPPQGGAPYSPFKLRLSGPDEVGEGIAVEMTATDAATGEELAYTTLTMGLTCANVGENAGHWVGSEAHLRYGGWTLDALDGRLADVTIHAEAMADPSIAADVSASVALVLD
ncbi:MAG: hypothetical protein ABMB14_09440 [Myxococcota bacterium]